MKNDSLIWKQLISGWNLPRNRGLVVVERRSAALILSLISMLFLPSQFAMGQDEAATKVFDGVISEELIEEPKEVVDQEPNVEQDAQPKVSTNNELSESSEDSKAAVAAAANSTTSQAPKSETRESEAPDNRTTAEKLEELKEEVLAVNRDLFVLEEDLLFPASTQLATYFSVDIGYFFSLDNIKLKIDDKQVSHFFFTEKDVDALYRGAIQKVYLGNVSTGEHEIVAVLIGHGPRKREYKVAVSAKFEKTTDAKAIEIQLRDNTGKLQPKLSVVEW